VAEMEVKRLGTWERKILRRVHVPVVHVPVVQVPVVEQGVWRVRTNEKLWSYTKLHKNLDTVKIKFTQKHTTKTQMGSTGIAPLFL
jgi:hypothetical protein